MGEGRSTSVEIHIGPTIAVLFFNDYSSIQPAKCYLLPKGIDQLDSFLPILLKLVKNGPSLFVARLALNILEFSPRPIPLPFISVVANTWMGKYPDDSVFWVEYGIGHRVGKLIDGIRNQEPNLVAAGKVVRFEVN